jgi:hypothetical protein
LRDGAAMKKINYYWYRHDNRQDQPIPDVYGTVYVMPGMKQWMLICIIEGNYVPPNAIHCNDVIKFLETPK